MASNNSGTKLRPLAQAKVGDFAHDKDARRSAGKPGRKVLAIEEGVSVTLARRNGKEGTSSVVAWAVAGRFGYAKLKTLPAAAPAAETADVK